MKAYNRLVAEMGAQRAPEMVVVSTGALAGLLVSGLLFGLPGAILPSWGYHLSSDFAAVGNYFLSLCAGVALSVAGARELRRRKGSAFLLVVSCATACAALIYLAFIPPVAAPLWRMAGMLAIGFAAGLLNSGVLHGLTPLYERDPAATVNLSGIFFGLGCLIVALLVAGTFYAYTVTSILLLTAVIPGFFAIGYARSRVPSAAVRESARGEAWRLFRSPGGVLFALLLFFQFGNEWAVAGWLPIFLTHRLGINPAASLILLAIYWASLLSGRIGALVLIPSVRHAKLLFASSGAALFGCLLLLSTNNLFGAVTGTMLAGGGFACIYPLIAAQIGRRFPWSQPGFFDGIVSFALLSGMLAPAAAGYVASLWGIRVVMALPLAGTCLVFGLVLLIWLDARLRGENDPPPPTLAPARRHG